MDRQIRVRVDWFRVLADLKQRGISISGTSEQTDIPKATLHYYKSGGEPNHSYGERLIEFWCRVTGNSDDKLPKENAGFSAAKIKNK